MKRILILLMILFLPLPLVSAQTGKAASKAAARIESKVLSLEQQWADALMKSDTAALEQLYADDLIYTHSSGVTDDKTKYIGAIKSGATKYEEVRFESQSVKVYGQAAIVFSTCRVRVMASGQKLENTLKLVHIYAREGRTWRMVAHQSTRTTQ